VDGWNSLSIHFFAAVSDADAAAGAAAGAVAVAGAVAAALGSSFLPQADSISTTAPTAESEYIESERFMIDFLGNFPLSGETHRLGR
jgi:adenine/guanine phosphoribosyltransferase-like PRPP-binding protein